MNTMKMKPEELVDDFCSITGADRSTGSCLLEACAGNLELAVNMHMESGAETGGSSDIDGVRAPIPQTQEILVENAPSYAPGFRGRKRKLISVFDGFRDFREEARQQEAALAVVASGSHAVQKTKTLQDLFRPPIDITYKGTFINAREAGKLQRKWLMVNIQNVKEFACQTLNRDVWSNSAVKALVRDNFIFWQVYIDSEEGQKYTQFYKVDTWPYVAVLDPQTGENLVAWNNIEPLTFCDLVSAFLHQHPTADSFSTLSYRQEDSFMDLSEDDQLHAAITASLTNIDLPKQVVTVTNSDSDSSDLETFTDSDEEIHCTMVKSHDVSTTTECRPLRNSQSPTPRQSLRIDSISSNSSPKKIEMGNSPKRSKRSASPLTGSVGNADAQRSQRKCSPKQSVDQSSLAQATLSPSRKSSPHYSKQSPVKISTPKKEQSINNSVHPAVVENIKKHTSPVKEAKDSSKITGNNFESSTKCESEVSLDDNVFDKRDYKKFLGPDTDEKATLMLRLPNGQREKLCISFSSKLLALVLFVCSKGFSSKRFELIAQFPHRQLSQFDHDSTLRDIGLHAQETIFVQARS